MEVDEGHPTELICNQCDPAGMNRKVVRVEGTKEERTYHLECGHIYKTFSRALKEAVTISYTTDSFLAINPSPEIEQALESGDYFKAATYLAATLEYYAKLVLNEKLKAENIEVNDKRIVRFSLEDVAILLYSTKVIGQPTYSAMLGLNGLRNDLMHIKDFAEFRRRSGTETEAIVRNAMKCIEALTKRG